MVCCSVMIFHCLLWGSKTCVYNLSSHICTRRTRGLSLSYSFVHSNAQCSSSFPCVVNATVLCVIAKFLHTFKQNPIRLRSSYFFSYRTVLHVFCIFFLFFLLLIRRGQKYQHRNACNVAEKFHWRFAETIDLSILLMLFVFGPFQGVAVRSAFAIQNGPEKGRTGRLAPWSRSAISR